jgi:hypothetical protein
MHRGCRPAQGRAVRATGWKRSPAEAPLGGSFSSTSTATRPSRRPTRPAATVAAPHCATTDAPSFLDRQVGLFRVHETSFGECGEIAGHARLGQVGPGISPDALRSAYDPQTENAIVLAKSQVEPCVAFIARSAICDRTARAAGVGGAAGVNYETYPTKTKAAPQGAAPFIVAGIAMLQLCPASRCRLQKPRFPRNRRR